jgi:hypothetical protein
MGNQHTKKQEETLQAQLDALALKRQQEAAAALAVRSHVRIRIYRNDGTIDETTQSFRKMEPGEGFTTTLTPETV